ncbi:21130_t:CDS:2, partial [Racocetra persica]
LNTIVENTNYYAIAKSADIFKLPSKEDYWKADWKYPQHNITKYMTLVRFEQ